MENTLGFESQIYYRKSYDSDYLFSEESYSIEAEPASDEEVDAELMDEIDAVIELSLIKIRQLSIASNQSSYLKRVLVTSALQEALLCKTRMALEGTSTATLKANDREDFKCALQDTVQRMGLSRVVHISMDADQKDLLVPKVRLLTGKEKKKNRSKVQQPIPIQRSSQIWNF